MNILQTLVLAISLFEMNMVFAQNPPGIFDQSADVGPVLHPGKTEYNAATQTYLLSGSGANIWFKKDEFHYAYKQVKGNVILQCRGKLVGKGVDLHRKFGSAFRGWR